MENFLHKEYFSSHKTTEKSSFFTDQTLPSPESFDKKEALNLQEEAHDKHFPASFYVIFYLNYYCFLFAIVVSLELSLRGLFHLSKLTHFSWKLSPVTQTDQARDCPWWVNYFCSERKFVDIKVKSFDFSLKTFGIKSSQLWINLDYIRNYEIKVS